MPQVLVVSADSGLVFSLRGQAASLGLDDTSFRVVRDLASLAHQQLADTLPPVDLALIEDEPDSPPQMWLAALRSQPVLRGARLVVLTTGEATRHLALLRVGCDDVLPKPRSLADAGRDLLVRQLAHAERDAAHRRAQRRAEHGYGALAGLSQRLQALRQTRGKLLDSGAPALQFEGLAAGVLLDAVQQVVPGVDASIWQVDALPPRVLATSQTVPDADADLHAALSQIAASDQLPQRVFHGLDMQPEPWSSLGQMLLADANAGPAFLGDDRLPPDAWLWPVSVAAAPWQGIAVGPERVAVLLLLYGRDGSTAPDDGQRAQVLDLVAGTQGVFGAATGRARDAQPPAADGAWHTIVAHLPEAMFTFDRHGMLLAANASLAVMAGRELSGIQGRSLHELLAPLSRAAVFARMQQLSAQGNAGTGEEFDGAFSVNLMLPDGRLRAADLTIRLLRGAGSDGDVVFAGVFHDPRGAERLSREFHAMLDVVRLMASEQDPERAIAGVGQVLVEQAGYHSGQVLTVAENGTQLVARSMAPGSAISTVPMDRSILGRVARERRTELVSDVHSDPDYFEVDPSVTSGIYVPMLRDARLIGVLAIEESRERVLDEHDVTFLQSMASLLSILVERAELYLHLEHEAKTDLVTQLPNRQVLQQQLERTAEKLARPTAVGGIVTSGPVSMLIAGIDSFKVINELYGHATADDILRQVAATVRQVVPAGQFVARHTSDQFAILLDGITRDDAVSIAEEVRIAVATRLFTAAEQVEQVTLSIGSATWPDDVATIGGLLLAADHAMFLAKRAGRNQVFQSNKAFATLAPAHGRITHLLRQSPRETLSMLVHAMDQRLPERQGHSERVARYAVALAHATGYPDEELSRLRLAAYIHDIGMVSLPDSLLRKPGALTECEREQLRRVPLAARDLLSQLDEFPSVILRAVVHQRERWDGTGDPDRLAGEAIPREAQLIALADAMDAMLHARAHRASISFDEAVQQVHSAAGTKFDPRLAAAVEVLRPIVNAIQHEEQQATVI